MAKEGNDRAFEDGGVGGELHAHLHKGADDVDAHADGLVAIEDGRDHEVPCSVKA